MCSSPVKKAINTTAAVVNPVALLANVGPIGFGKGAAAGYKQGGVTGALRGGVSGTAGSVTDPVGTLSGVPTQNSSEDIPADPVPTAAEPTPTFTPPTPSESAAMRKRRRLNALRMGITSTILTGGSGAAGAAQLLTPTAGGSDLKKALGA